MKLKTFTTAAALLAAAFTSAASAADRTPADLNDLEIAHVAYTADNLDIRYAHLALAISTNPEIHAFANTMISDHSAVNEAALGLLAKLGANAQDNFLSQKLNSDGAVLIKKMSRMSGKKFDRFYAKNELGYHKAVNDLVENAFIPNIENGEVKALFMQGLEIFKRHEKHAENMVSSLR